MKKTYIEPSVEVVTVNAEQMICESVEVDGFAKAIDETPGSGDDALIEERLFGDFQPEPFNFLW